MVETGSKYLSNGVTAVLGWDIDGILCEIPSHERKIDKVIPWVIPGIQRFMQSPSRFLRTQRQKIGHTFLSRRVLDNEAFNALVEAYLKRGVFSEIGITVRNVICTERPETERHLIFNQLRVRIERLQQDGFLDRNVRVEDLVEGCWDNPYGGDCTQVKPNVARILGNRLHLLEDKVHTAKLVKKVAPASMVYVLTDSRDSTSLKTFDIIPVTSPAQFVDCAYADIQSRIPVTS